MGARGGVRGSGTRGHTLTTSGPEMGAESLQQRLEEVDQVAQWVSRGNADVEAHFSQVAQSPGRLEDASERLETLSERSGRA